MVESKAWGLVRHIFDGPVSVSLLRTEANGYCSWHYHEHRWNMFYVVSGTIIVIVDDNNDGKIQRHILRAGDSYKVGPSVRHMFDVVESGQVVETYWTDDGTDVTIDDIVRLAPGGMR